MKYKEIKTVMLAVLKYFKENPHIHISSNELVKIMNHNIDYDDPKYTMDVEIKIAALNLVSDGKLALDDKWRIYLNESNNSRRRE